MFRMEFQTLDVVEEDHVDSLSRTTYQNDGGRGKSSVYELYRPKAVESRSSSSARKASRVGKMQRSTSANAAVLPDGSHLASVLTRSVRSSASTTVPHTWVEVDLINFGSPKCVTTDEPPPVDQNVLRELVKPFADSVNVSSPQPFKNSRSRVRANSEVFVSFLEYKPPGQSSRDLLLEDVEYAGENSQTRSSSMRSSPSTSWSDVSDAESSPLYADKANVKDEEKSGSPAAKAYNRAFSILMLKKNKPSMSDAKSVKPWEEPLFASHEQEKLERKLHKDAKAEAKRLAEEAKRDAEIRKREILMLANPVPESAMGNQKEQYNMRKGIHKLFQISSGSLREGVADARESKLVLPKVSLSCVSISPSDVAFGHVRSFSRPSPRRDIHFATVESNQRDVEAWTMEEYMARNSRLPEWTARENDEEFGGIEGNQLLQNQYFDDDVADNLDSDSD